MDDIALSVWRKEKTGDKGSHMMPATDSEGIRAMFELMAAQHRD